MIKQLYDFPNYTISDNGTVYTSNGVIKLPSKCKKGYLHITLSNKGIKKTFLLHRLIAIHFIPNPLNLPQVNHIDGNKENNTVNNLEWCTASDNIKHSFKNGMSNYAGENCGRALLTNSQVLDIKQRIINGEKNKDIAKQYNINPNRVSDIRHKRKWNCV